MKSDSIFKCLECEEVFHKKFDFLEHKNIHSGETPFMCVYCRKSFSLIKQYVDHIKIQHIEPDELENESENTNPEPKIYTRKNSSEEENISEDQFQCTKCSKSFEYSRSVKNHICKENSKHSKSEKVLHQCNCCSCQINNLQFKESHLQTVLCQNCNKKFPTREALNKHACFIPVVGENFKCSCSLVFSKASDFKAHIKSKPYSCCSCSMQFNTITNLIRHIRTHTKQKPYICKDCGRGFSQSAHLRNHSSLHLGINAVKCNECNFSCKTFNGLLKHKKKHKDGFLNHQNYVDGRKRSTKTSTCPICNKQFLFKRNMGMHMKIHKNKISLCTECGKVFDSKGKLTSHFKACHKEPSVCKTCGKVFASAVLLGAHEKIHVSEKLFPCNVCHKTFSIKNYLVQHMKTHSDKKQFSCTKCGKLFKVAISLKYHSNICTTYVPV